MRFGRRIGQRDANEPEIVGALRKAGAEVQQLHEPFDLLVGYRGRLYGLEVKLPLGPRGGDRSGHGREGEREQRERQRRWAGCFRVVRSVDEALEVVGA